MGLTRIKSNSPSFIQPFVGGTVQLNLDPAIDWIQLGSIVNIQGGGEYEVIAISGFSHTLELIVNITEPEQVVPESVIYPVKESNEAGSPVGLSDVLTISNNAEGRKITGLAKGAGIGDAVAFEQIYFDENINPLVTYNTAAGN